MNKFWKELKFKIALFAIKQGLVQRVVIDKPFVKILLKTSRRKKVCRFCHKKITVKNFGGLTKKGYICFNIVCLIEFYTDKGKKPL